MINIIPFYQGIKVSIGAVNTQLPVIANFASANFADLDFSFQPEPAKTILSELLREYFRANGSVDCSIQPENTIHPILSDWQGFLNACDVPEMGGNGVFQALLSINQSLAMDAYQLMLRLLSGQGDIREIRTLNFLYSILVPQLSVELVNKLQEAITENNIPINIF